MESHPPLQETYKSLFENFNEDTKTAKDEKLFIVEECQLPIIDLSRLNQGMLEREECKREIAKASSEWGFFQVVNHGISREILQRMRSEQVKLFRQPFNKKANENLLNCSTDSYRWGTPTATCLKQFSWIEAFHVPLTDILDSSEIDRLSLTILGYATTVSELAQNLAEILAENLGLKKTSFFKENCMWSTCYLRMNRYPPCPISSEVYGLMPHTDSDFLTVLYQDQVGGLQLVKDGSWFTVNPNPEALIINIGDLFQAWSNGVYKSVEHRVMVNRQVERFSVAYFLCPSYETVIQSCMEPSVYRKFSFKEYRQQVKEDVQSTGNKVGLLRFLLSSQS